LPEPVEPLVPPARGGETARKIVVTMCTLERLSVALALSSMLLAAQPLTFSKNIAPIVFEHCAPCHRPGESAPFSLLTYGDLRKRGGQIVQVTRQRYMPPWMPEPGYGDFADSLRLSDHQIDILARWVSQGMPEGDSADLPPPPRFTEGWQLGTPDMIVRMSQPYHLNAASGDVFRNFVLPVNLKETSVHSNCVPAISAWCTTPT